MFYQPKNFFYTFFSYPNLLVPGSGLITPDPGLAGGYRGMESMRQSASQLAKSLGLAPADITALSAACTGLFNLVNNVEAAKAALKNAVEAKNAGKDSNIALIRKANNKMKANDAYTDAIGDDMGIKGESQDLDLEAAKPKFSGEAFPGYIRLKFSKNGLDGVNIYYRGGWNFVARDTNSPYDDHKTLSSGAPETREYMCIGVMEDTEVGRQSDIVTVVFGG